MRRLDGPWALMAAAVVVGGLAASCSAVHTSDNTDHKHDLAADHVHDLDAPSRRCVQVWIYELRRARRHTAASDDTYREQRGPGDSRRLGPTVPISPGRDRLTPTSCASPLEGTPTGSNGS